MNGEVFENTRSIPRLHNRYLLEMLGELFAQASIDARDLTAIGFAAGPGSFTGVRISAAVAQALALAARAQVVPLDSSRLLAHAAVREGLLDTGPTGDRGVQTVLRSRSKFAYLASYRLVATDDPSTQACVDLDGLHTLERDKDDELMEDDVLSAVGLPAGWIRVMDTDPQEAAALGARCVSASVADLLTLTDQVCARGDALPPEGAQPRYVEGDTPWVPQ